MKRWMSNGIKMFKYVCQKGKIAKVRALLRTLGG